MKYSRKSKYFQETDPISIELSFVNQFRTVWGGTIQKAKVSLHVKDEEKRWLHELKHPFMYQFVRQVLKLLTMQSFKNKRFSILNVVSDSHDLNLDPDNSQGGNIFFSQTYQ